MLVRNLRKAGCALPEFGCELVDSDGEIYGMAELAWPEERVLTEQQIEFGSAAEAARWHVLRSACDLEQLASALNRAEPAEVKA